MIELYLSTNKNIKSEEIIDELMKTKIECQIYNNISAINSCGESYKENGFYLKLFNVTEKNFKKKVWMSLQSLLDVHCAHVKYENKYEGCVMNWPNVFVKSKCNLFL
tara:strand:+ start:181 stop:501 length:321 start_codon:yes stop_codon:yes gene_type:complete